MTELPDTLTAPSPLPPRTVRLVAIDLDGTLLRDDKRLTRTNYDAVRACVDCGVKVVLASARPPRSVRSVYETLGLDTVVINYNGALISDPSRKRHLHHEPMPAPLVKKVIATARKADPKCLVSIEILDKWYTDHFDVSLPTETSLSFNPDFIGPLNAFLNVPVTKLMLLAPGYRMDRICRTVQRRFAGKVGFTTSDTHMLQVMHRAVDKSDALRRVAALYGVPQHDVMAIGDAPNDAAMLGWAGLGVAMGNAWPRTRTAADVVVPSNEADGVAHAIHHYVLGQRA